MNRRLKCIFFSGDFFDVLIEMTNHEVRWMLKMVVVFCAGVCSDVMVENENNVLWKDVVCHDCMHGSDDK